MSEFTPHLAPIVVLLFLGTALLLGVSFLVLFYGAAPRGAPPSSQSSAPAQY
jgi:hypothetical protein